MTLIVFGMVLPWVLLFIGAWVAYSMVRQNGRILLRLDAIEQRIGRPGAKSAQPPPAAHPEPGLEVGTAAPSFQLPDLAGTIRSLSSFRGRDVLLMFFNPACGFCAKMAPELAALPADGLPGGPLPVVVASGERDKMAAFVREHGIACTVLLQEKMEVAAKYHAKGTPMGCLIDDAGLIASDLAVGADPLLELAAGAAGDARPKQNRLPDPRKEAQGKYGKKAGNRPLEESRLNRTGLKSGTPAPEFELPRLDEGTMSLADLRGQRVLLVFSDPQCGPCDQLAPRLEQIHRERTDLQVLMVTRRDIDENRVKVAKLGLTFPVLLQKNWEISLKYGMFATPVGYAIDEHGVIISDVAVGVDPILALADTGPGPIDVSQSQGQSKEVASTS